MAGINGCTVAFRAQANKRIAKFSALVKDTADTTQNQQYAGLPGAANAPGFMGVTTEHFVEPNYFVPQGTDPSTVTGTTPVLYNLVGRAITVQDMGIARFYSASAINQGDAVNIADVYGRVKTATEAAGTVNRIGYAQNTTSAVNDVVEVLISIGLQ